MPETAREYGLRVDWWVDERADPERSTRAAAQYIKDLYRQFNDWPLALAAYNCGPGRIRRALADNGATTFWELCDVGAMPKETRGYVPTFFATLLIASDPATYGFRSANRDDIDVEARRVAARCRSKYLAEVAGVDDAIAARSESRAAPRHRPARTRRRPRSGESGRRDRRARRDAAQRRRREHRRLLVHPARRRLAQAPRARRSASTPTRSWR